MRAGFKKIGVGVVSILILLCLTVFLACATDDKTAVQATQQNTEYTVRIPAYIRPVDIGEQHIESEISAEATWLPQDTALNISVDFTEKVMGDGQQSLSYKMYCANSVITARSTVLSVRNSEAASTTLSAELTEKAKYAGAYTDTAIFRLAVESVTYTPEEIAKDPYLFGIGKTKSEYVLARFSEDFTTVTIFKNGADSDGLMMDWAKTTSATTADNSPMRQHKDTLESVTIRDGVASIGNYAFYQCDKMTSAVEFPLSIAEIGEGAYRECHNLTVLDLSTSSVENIGIGAFLDCYNITSALNFPETLKSIGSNAFAANGSTLSKGIYMQFSGDLNLPDSVEYCGNATFQGCAELDGTLHLSANMTEIPAGFAMGCISLTGDIIIPDGVTRIGQSAFNGKIGSTSYDGELVIPDSVTAIDKFAFAECSNLQGDLIIPETVTTITEASFQNCAGFSSVSFGDIEAIEAWAFNGCSGLQGDLIMPKSLRSIGYTAFQECRGFKGELVFNEGLEFIGDFAFNHCSDLSNTVLNIPSTVKRIGGDYNMPAGTYAAVGTHVFQDFAIRHLKEYQVAAGNTAFKAENGALYTADGTRLINVAPMREGEIFEIPEGVLRLDEYAIWTTGSPIRSHTLVLPNSFIITAVTDRNLLNAAHTNTLTNGVHNSQAFTTFAVKDDNPRYTAYDGCIYSKDGKTLYAVPAKKVGILSIPEGTEKIEIGALNLFNPGTNGASGCKITTLEIPSTLGQLDSTALAAINFFIGEGGTVVIAEGNTALGFDGNGHIINK